MSNKRKCLFIAMLALVAGVTITQVCFAKTTLNAEDEAMFSQNNILFYEPCGTGNNDSDNNNASICNADLPEETLERLESENIKQKAEQNMERYKYASDQTGVMWQAIAALHYREGGMSQDQSILNGEKLYDHINVDGKRISSDANEDAKNAAEHLIAAGKSVYNVDIVMDQSKDALAKAFLAYNRGNMYTSKCGEDVPYTSSPYVMNYYDSQHMEMTWIHADSYCGSTRINGVEGSKNTQLGALVILSYLCGDEDAGASIDSGSDDLDTPDTSDGNVSNDSDITGGAKAISDTAAQLAWPKKYGREYYYEPNKNEGSHRYDAYVKAVEELGLKGHGHTIIPDCGDFVETVVKYSGYDKNFVQKLSYLKKKTKLWDIIEWDGKDASKLKAGDILYSNKSGNGDLKGHDSAGQHWWVITEIDDQLYTAEASLSAKTWGRIKKKVNKNYKPYQGKGYWIIRAKDDDSTKPSCDAKVEGSKNINATGVALAWPLGTDKDKYTLASGKVLESVLSSPGVTDTFSGTGSGTALFQEAWIKSRMSKNSLINKLNDGRYSWRYGAYCCGFTAVVARYSGYDTHFDGSLSEGEYEQVVYARNHSDLWEVIEWDKNKSSLQGGDILVSSTHSWMVVEDEKGELYRAEASLSSYEFGHISKYSSSASGKTYIIRAKNANNSNVGVSVTDGVKSSSTSGIVTSSVQNSHDIGAVARFFAWPLGTEKSKYAHYPKEKEAWKTLLKNNGFTNFGQTNMGHDCGVFVSGVLRYAGLTNSMGKQGTPIIPDEVDNGENGWYKVDTDGTKESDLQDGDVIYYYHDSGHTDLYHFAIFLRDENGKPLLAEAGHNTKYGLITEFSTHGYMSVFRNRNNKTGSGSSSNNNECSLCPTDDDSSGNNSGDGTIVEGGFKTKEEAQKIADAYNKANLSSIAGMGSACGGNYHLNCVNFSKWFIHTYLKGMDIGFKGNGGDIADNFYKANKGKFPNLKESNVPVAYSIFSVRQTPGLSSSNEGHTGVILGINGGQVIFAEAAWCKFTGQVRTLPISSFTSGQYHKFIDVNAYINGGI